MTLASELVELEIMPGMMPSTDATASDIPCWSIGSRVRFDPTTGRLRKLAGWSSIPFSYDATISGTMRSIYSATINQRVATIIGTNSGLYSINGSRLSNITPLSTSSTGVANSLATHYATLANNPITTVNGSTSISIADTEASLFKVGDTYTLSGAATVNGVPNTDINKAHIIRSLGVNVVGLTVATAATSSGSGGGGAVVRSSGLITLTKVAHGLLTGERLKIASAVAFGGITAPQINMEFEIRNVLINSFDVMTSGTATSSVSAAGGAGTIYYQQIAAGALNQGAGQGYGAGFYGVGLYGTALISSSGETYPRIWFSDRYGDNIITTAGNSTGVYTWDGIDVTAPTLITNAPTDINYAFVQNNILVTFGHDVENKIFSSDQGNYTQWTASSNNQVFEDTIEGAGRFISHVPVDGYSLIFTETQTYIFKYIGLLSGIFQILQLDSTIGILAPMARVSVNGYGYWMGADNFYMYRGGKVEVIPSNFGKQSSCLRYVFDNLNYSQRYKIFAWYNENYDEIWWHYPTANSNECDRVVRFNRKLTCWAVDEMDRTAAEYPIQNLSNPRLGNVGTFYLHETGNDDDGAAMAFSATTKKYLSGTRTNIISQIIPDSKMTGTIALGINTYNYPQSATAMNGSTYNITSTTEKVPTQVNGRYSNFTISGEELGQSFLMGQWMIEPQKAARTP
tara:strand:+ start:46 stop:2100 length:2055 start_codon:yes stop_codon:yes gene_type:complete